MSYRQLKLFLYLFLFIFLVYFFAQNSEAKADFYIYGLVFKNVPVIILMLLSFCGGMLFWVLFNYINLPFKSKKIETKNKKIETIEAKKGNKKTPPN